MGLGGVYLLVCGSWQSFREGGSSCAGESVATQLCAWDILSPALRGREQGQPLDPTGHSRGAAVSQNTPSKLSEILLEMTA